MDPLLLAALFFTAYEQGKKWLPFEQQTTILLSSMAGETVCKFERKITLFTGHLFLVGLFD